MEQRPFQEIRAHQVDGTLTLTLHRPDKRNALTTRMVNELIWALDDARDDPETRVIVLTGAGGAFCSGADLRQMGTDADAPSLPLKGDFADLLLRFPALGKPTVARVPGPALGGGLGLVASCDFAIACESATLGTPEVRRGLWPMMIMAVLARCVPHRRLLPMMLLGEKLSAVEARDAGILTHCVPDEDMDEVVGQVTGALAEQSPTAMALGLRAYHQQRGMPLDESVPYLREQLMGLLGTEDAREGLAAFIERREPVWKGR